MRRIHFLAVGTLMLGALMFALSIPFAPNVASSSATILQTRGTTTTLRRFQVTAQAIAALASTKKYVVDLTQRGVIYEFNAQTSQVDFNRVTVRTARGEVAIGSFLEKTFPKDKLTGFKYTSQSFILGTRATGTGQPPPRATPPLNLYSCSSIICACHGREDCISMIFDDHRCGGPIICRTDQDGDDVCICARNG